jgi:hypothetical protein
MRFRQRAGKPPERAGEPPEPFVARVSDTGYNAEFILDRHGHAWMKVIDLVDWLYLDNEPVLAQAIADAERRFRREIQP